MPDENAYGVTDAFSRKAGTGRRCIRDAKGWTTTYATSGSQLPMQGSETSRAGNGLRRLFAPAMGARARRPFEPLQLTTSVRMRQVFSDAFVWRLETGLMRVFCLLHRRNARTCGLAASKSGLWFECRKVCATVMIAAVPGITLQSQCRSRDDTRWRAERDWNRTVVILQS